MTFHERVVFLCNKNDISQSKLESDLGIAKGSVTKWKTAEPRRSAIIKIADYFNVSVDYLISGEENKTPIFEYSSDIMELIKLYSQLNKEQKSAILNMMRSFALNNQ